MEIKMDHIFNFDNAFFRAFDKIINVFCLSILWILFSIPVFTIGASTTALYYTVNKVLTHGRGYVFREFWGSFKSNFKQATVIWLILLAAGVFMGLDAYIMKQFYDAGQAIGKLFAFFYVMLGFLVVWALYIFPNIARFENTNRAIMKNAALMALASLPKTVLMVIMLAAFILVDWFFPFLIIVIPAAFMWAWSGILEKIFRRFMSEEDIAAEDERNREYKN